MTLNSDASEPLTAPVAPRLPGSSMPPGPYIVWDSLLVVAAVVTLLGFVASEDLPGNFWKLFGFRVSISLLAALALYLSVRFRVPNLAVVSIALFASVVAGKAAGPDGSPLMVLGLAAVIGLVVGLVLAGLVVGLRIPAWGATLGVTGLLLAGSLRLTDQQTLQVAIGNSVVDWGIPLLLISVALSIGVAIVSLVLIGSSDDDDAATRQPERTAQTLALQAGALVVSSAMAALAGALLALRATSVNGQIGLDLTVPLAIVLLGAASLRGRGSGVVGLVAAAFVIETVSIWWSFREGELVDQLLIIGGLALVGLVAGGVLELVSSGQHRRTAEPWQASPPSLPLPVRPDDAEFESDGQELARDNV